MNNQNIVEIKEVSKSYHTGEETITIFTGLNLELSTGQIYALYGPSGSGKSTLLHLIGGLDQPDQGEIFVNGNEINGLNDEQCSLLRKNQIGYIFQFHHLMSDFSLIENVAIPSILSGKSKKKSFEKAAHLLELVGLKKRIEHRPSQLSGGERQRGAVARAFANDPALILADEPTGNLDLENAKLLLDLIIKLNQEFNKTFFIATHDQNISKIANLQLVIENHNVRRK